MLVKYIDHTENGISRHAACGGQPLYAVKGSVQYTVSIHNKKLIHECYLRLIDVFRKGYPDRICEQNTKYPLLLFFQ